MIVTHQSDGLRVIVSLLTFLQSGHFSRYSPHTSSLPETDSSLPLYVATFSSSEMSMSVCDQLPQLIAMIESMHASVVHRAMPKPSCAPWTRTRAFVHRFIVQHRDGPMRLGQREAREKEQDFAHPAFLRRVRLAG